MNVLSSLTKLVAVAQAISALFPAIITAVEAAEGALGTGAGAAKFAMVEGSLKAIYATEQEAVATWEEISPAVTGIVNTVVAAYNAAKVFFKPAVAQTPAA